MPYIAPEVIAEAKKMDLLTYLRIYEPHELVHFSGNTYTTKTHDSLKISNGKWMWWSRGIGGKNALDYLTKVKEVSFLEAVEIIMGKRTQAINNYHYEPKKEQAKQFILPQKNATAYKITQYLLNRGIDREIINYCLENELIYESFPHHNVVFVGKDEQGIPRYAAYRAANNLRIMGDAAKSDKHFSFRLEGTNKTEVHFFECAIDALSYATLLKIHGREWRRENLVSLAGVYAPKEKITDAKRIMIHFDNDEVGKIAAETLKTKLSDKYEVINKPPKVRKDFNEFLCSSYRKFKHNERSFER